MLDEDHFLLLCSCEIGEADWTALSAQERAEALKAREAEKDYEVLEEIPFWSNGGGFTSRKRARLYLFTRSSGRPNAHYRRMVRRTRLCRAGQKALFWGAEYRDKAAQTEGLFAFDAASGEKRCLLPDGRFGIHTADFWGGEVVFFGSEMRRYGLNENPALFALRGGEPAPLWDRDEVPGSNVGSDCRLGGGKHIRFDGDFVYYTAARDVDTVLARAGQGG